MRQSLEAETPEQRVARLEQMSTLQQHRLEVETPIIGRAKRAPHWGVQSRFRVIYIYMYICRYVSYVKLTA